MAQNGAAFLTVCALIWLGGSCGAIAASGKRVDCDAAFYAHRVNGKELPAICAGAQLNPMSGAIPEAALKASPACQKLADDYESASKEMAMNFAESVGDNSAIRATMREQQNQTALERARFTVDLMKSNRCTLPTEAPNMKRYLTPALDCKLAEVQQGGFPPSCDMSKWVPKND